MQRALHGCGVGRLCGRRLCFLGRFSFRSDFCLLLAALLLLGRIFRLARGKLGLLSRFLLSTGDLLRVEHRFRRFRRGRLGLRRFPLDQHPLLAHLHLDGARLARAVRFADLARLPAGQRDLLLGFPGAMRLAKVVEQLGLVLLGERRLLGEHLFHSGRMQLLDEQCRRQPKLRCKLCDIDLRHRPFRLCL